MANQIYCEDSAEEDERVEEAKQQGIEVRVCPMCNKEFVPSGRNAWRQRYCHRVHKVNCAVCGKVIVLDPKKRAFGTNSVSIGCSKECIGKLRHMRQLESLQRKYGKDVVNVGQIPGSRKKAHDTMVRNNTYDLLSRKSKEFWSSRTPEQMDQILQKRRKTSLERWGYDNPSKSEIVKNKIRNTNSSSSVIQKYTETSLSNYGFKRPAQSREYMNNRKANYCVVDGVNLDSSWELVFYQFVTSIGKEVQRNVPINYASSKDKKEHVTFVDFMVDDVLFEIKSSAQLLKVFHMDTGMDDKLRAYRENNVVVVTDFRAADMFDPITKVGTVPDGTLRGVDISLFRQDRTFPSNLNRPDCFYKTSVNGKKSTYEGFFDNYIVWKMILNRLKYMGGFISGKQIVRGMSVTKTCPQPSWFSIALAKRLISKYCTSDTVVDPFAGWGARCEACRQLGKKYVGIDVNPASVEWNNSKGRNITLCDVQEFNYTESCSVFTCPPYGNKEKYTDNMENKSACDWMLIAIERIPNASEYVFVCDEVSEAFSPYVVETKTNSSHFTTNMEYVVRVPRERAMEIVKTCSNDDGLCSWKQLNLF